MKEGTVVTRGSHSLVCTLVSSELLLAAESSHEHTGLYGGGGRGGRRGRSSWPRPLPVQRPLADPGLPTCLTSSSSSPPFTPLSSCSRLLLSYSSASLSHHFLFLSLFSSNQQQQQIITLFMQVFFDRHGNTEPGCS